VEREGREGEKGRGGVASCEQGQQLSIAGTSLREHLGLQGQGLVNWTSRTSTWTFFENNNTGLQGRMAYLLTYISE